MSYILEALKKAQAERQLGNAPTLHAAGMQAPSLAQWTPWWRRPLVWLAALLALVIVALLVLLLRPAPSATPARLTSDAPPALASASSAAMAVAPAPAPAAALASAPAAQPAPPVARAASGNAASPVGLPAPLPVPVADAPLPSRSASRASASAVPSATASAAAGARASEEPVLNLRELPEPIQRAIPAVTLGGYIYSPNPAERLLLVDKVLRHEGEEVAPGLLLEKLQAREAIFSFRGYRYRMPY